MRANGEAIKAIRERSGIKQVEVARACDVDQAYISRIERGASCSSPNVLASIASCLKVPLTAIIHEY